LLSELLRKDSSFPEYVVISDRHLSHWHLAGTSVIEGNANGFPFGRRTIKSWGKESNNWFVEFTSAFCKKAKLSMGNLVSPKIKLADESTL